MAFESGDESGKAARTSADDVAERLAAAHERKASTDAFFELVYGELRRLASATLRKHPPQDELHTTVLVQETYLKLCEADVRSFADRSHFFVIAASAMRSILVDEARKRSRKKRRAGGTRIPLEAIVRYHETYPELLLMLDECMGKLEREDPGLARILGLRYFAGLEVAEVAELVEKPLRSVERELKAGRALLRSFLE